MTLFTNEGEMRLGGVYENEEKTFAIVRVIYLLLYLETSINTFGVASLRHVFPSFLRVLCNVGENIGRPRAGSLGSISDVPI